MTVHVYPVNDTTEHELEGEDCICGPTSELVETAAGDRWLVKHHALDGRQHPGP